MVLYTWIDYDGGELAAVLLHDDTTAFGRHSKYCDVMFGHSLTQIVLQRYFYYGTAK